MESSQSQRAGSGALASTIAQVQAEQRWLMLMRLAFGGVCLSWLLLLIWAVPGGPISGIVPDYSAAVVLGLFFGLIAFGGSLATFVIWRPSFSGERPAEFFRVLFGGGLLIRRPGQFKASLARALAGNDESALIVIQLAPDAGGAARRRKLEHLLPAIALRSAARGDDIVATGDANQLWLLATGVGEATRDQVVRRIGLALSQLPHFQRAQIGASTLAKSQAPAFAEATQSFVRLEDLAADQAA